MTGATWSRTVALDDLMGGRSIVMETRYWSRYSPYASRWRIIHYSDANGSLWLDYAAQEKVCIHQPFSVHNISESACTVYWSMLQLLSPSVGGKHLFANQSLTLAASSPRRSSSMLIRRCQDSIQPSGND